MLQNSRLVGTDEAREWSITRVLESRVDEGTGVTLRSSAVELDAAVEAGCGGVDGLLLGWLALQDPGLTTGNYHNLIHLDDQ